MVTSKITAIFSEPVKGAEANFSLIDLTTGHTVPADITTGIEGGRMTAILTPKGNLYYSRQYKVVLTTGITDYDTPPSAMAAEFSSTFTTKVPNAYDLESGQQFSGGRDITKKISGKKLAGQIYLLFIRGGRRGRC